MRPTHALEFLFACACAAPIGAALQTEPTAVVGVRLSAEAEAPLRTLILENGRIRAVLSASEAVPASLRRVDGDGLLAVPAFLDAFTLTGPMPPQARRAGDGAPSPVSNVPIDMPAAQRESLRPASRTVDSFALDALDARAYRAQGFGALHVAQGGYLLGGWSAIVTTRTAPLRECVVAPVVFQSATFASPGEGVPTDLMGCIAELRQFFLDARHHELSLARAGRGGQDRRPPYDPELEAASSLLADEGPLLCLAQRAVEVERWLALAEEAGTTLWVAGGRDAWRLADELAASAVPVLLTLEWDEEVPDPEAPDAALAAESRRGDPWHYEEPAGVRRERRREWLLQRDGALRLHEAGVRFAFGTGGGAPKELLAKVRQLVVAGLPREAALAGLTSRAAELLGVGDRLGTLAPDRDASFGLWSAHPLAPEAQLVRLFVDGFEHEIRPESDADDGEPAADVVVAGRWSIRFEGEEVRPATLTLVTDGQGAVTGRFETTSPADDSAVAIDVSGRLVGALLTLRGVRVGPSFRITMDLEGTIEGDTLSGEAAWTYSAGEQRAAFSATRAPD